MNRTLRSILSVFIASAALAVGLHLVVPKRTATAAKPDVGAAVDEFVSGIREVLPEAVNVVASVVDQVQAWTGFAPAPGYDQNVVLLKEPVLILNGSLENSQALTKGTQLSLVRQEGAYLRVKHATREITIPRSAAVSGTFHGR